MNTNTFEAMNSYMKEVIKEQQANMTEEQKITKMIKEKTRAAKIEADRKIMVNVIADLERRIEAEEAVEAVTNEDASYVVRYMINETEFDSKPSGDDVKEAGLHNMTIVSTTVAELAEELSTGKTVKPGILLKGTGNKNWVGQQLFFADIDDAGVTIEDSMNTAKKLGLIPAIVYKSFSYTEEHQKHRLVFVANKQIKDANAVKSIMNYIITNFKSDERTRNLSRMFYGTCHKDYMVNNSVINADLLINMTQNNICITSEPSGANGLSGLDTDSNSTHIYNPKINNTKGYIYATSLNHLTSGQDAVLAKVTDFINNKNVSDKYRNMQFTNFTQLKSYIKTISLEEVFGGNRMSCLFHEDNNPSVSIYKDEEGHSYYKCHSCGEHLDMLSLIAIAFDIDTTESRWIVQAAKVLMTKLNLSLVNNEWYTAELDMIKTNRLFLLNKLNRIADKYPMTFKAISKNKELLRLMLDIAEAQLDVIELSDVDYAHKLIFKMSSTYAAKEINKHQTTALRNLDDLVLMGLVTKLSDDELKELNPAIHASNVKLAMARGDKFTKTIQAYTMNIWDEKQMQLSEDMLTYIKAKGATKAGATQRQYKALGCNTRVKADIKEEGVADSNLKVLLAWARKTLLRKGYFTKNDLIEYARTKNISQSHTASLITTITTKTGATRVTVKNDNLNQYNFNKKDLRKTAFVL